MARIEIEESELANLRQKSTQYDRQATILERIGKNPKLRGTLQAVVAEAAPEEAGMEHYLRAEFKEELSGVSKKLDDFFEEQRKEREDRKAEAATRALEQRWATGQTAARQAGYTAEGLTQLEEFMEQNGIADHKLAIPAFEKANPPPEPVVTGGSRWNFFDRAAEAENDAAYKALMNQDYEGFLERAVPAALKDLRGG